MISTDPSAQRMPPVTLGIIAGCGLVHVLLGFAGGGVLLEWFALWPPGPRAIEMTRFGPWRAPDFQVWQLFTYAFLHGGLAHLFLNLFGLWMFGSPVERVFGARRFLVFYAVSVLGAGLAQILAAQYSGEIVPTIGASGGVLGVVAAFGLLFPRARIQLLFPPVNMRAPVFVLVFAGVELLFGMSGTMPTVAHFAHLGGMAAGAMLVLVWRAQGVLIRRR